MDVLRLLGNAGPYLILVGLVVFGFYKFQELSQQRDIDLQKVRETATESYRQQLSAANKALVETYQAMGNISGTQIKNLSEMLELHARATTRTQEIQQAQEQQRLKLEQALRDVDAAGNQKKQFEVDLKVIRDNVARDKAELDRLQAALKEGRRNLSDSAVQVSTVREKMIELAHAVRDKDASSALQLAAEILKENKDPIDVELGKSDASALRALIGRSDADTVADLVKNDKFTFVIRTVSGRDIGGIESRGSRLLAGEAPSGSLFRNVAQLQSDGSRIVGTDVVGSLFGVAAADEDDWYSVEKSLVSQSENSSTRWRIRNERETWSPEDIPDKNEVLKSSNRTFPYLNLEQLENQAPDIFVRFRDGLCGLSCRMYARAKVFAADSLFLSSNAGELSGVPRELRIAAIRLFNAAVKHQLDEAASLVVATTSSTALLGQLAAIVLRPDFEFTKYVPSANNEPGNSANSVALVGHYDYNERGFRKSGFAREQIATFVFSRRDNAGWQLEHLTSVPKDPVSASK